MTDHIEEVLPGDNGNDPEKKGRILVVDDEEGLRHTFALFLTREGYSRVCEAGSVAEAVALLGSEQFDLVISDIVLGDGNGIDLLREIRQRNLQCPVVMVTGYPNIETAAEAVRLGAYDYLPKPVKKDALLDVARRALCEYLGEKDRHVREEESSRRLEFQKSAINSAPAMIVALNRRFEVLEVNELARLWAADHLPQIAVGRQLFPGMHPLIDAMLDEGRQVLDSAAARQERKIEWDNENRGCRSVLRMTVGPMQKEDGTVEGLVVTAHEEEAGLPVRQRHPGSNFHLLRGDSVAMRQLYGLIQHVGPVDTTVLITGESGCGKGLVADALHKESRRAGKSLVQVDCAAVSDEILESELFGHSKGAFTGADFRRPGRILQAHGGTLFLDEIGDISEKMQLRLLRFLQEKMFYPVGRDQPVQVDVRVIAATNADLKQKIQQGLFREDLYYRLRVVELHVPPLRSRTRDVALLAEYFLSIASREMGKKVKALADDAMSQLCGYSWPGNVRELEHVIKRAVVLCDGEVLQRSHLPRDILEEKRVIEEKSGLSEPAETAAGPSDSEAQTLVRALRKVGGNKAKAARILGMDRSTLYRKLAAHGIKSEDYDAEKFR